jgi:hypothetical protein
MLKRILLALALLIGLSAPAYAVEINTDVGCDTSGAWMLGTGWSLSGSKCVASSATRMSMLMQMSTAVKKNHRYKITADFSGVTGGIARAFVGVKMPSAPTGTTITAASVSAVADTFTTSLGLNSGGVLRSATGPGDDPERNGSWRISCVSGGFGRVDPLVYPGTIAPHLHEFVGASNMRPNWTYTDFRTKAISSCETDPKHVINRSAYWFPAVIDGHGNAKRTAPLLVYYKGPSNPSQPASVALTGSISGTTLTVTATGGVTNPISPDGEVINGAGITTNTIIVSQLSGTPGGIGTYQLNSSQGAIASETITLISPHKAGGEADGTAATMCHDLSYNDQCANVPRGLRFTFGYKGSFNATSLATSVGNCGPFDTANVGTSTSERCSLRGIYGWNCTTGPNGEASNNITASISGTTLSVTSGPALKVGDTVYVPGVVATGTKITAVGGGGSYTVSISQTVSSRSMAAHTVADKYTSDYLSLQEIMDAGVCAKGSWAARSLGFPACWDGVNVDTPDHRGNVVFGSSAGNVCRTATHPVRLPQISLLISYRVDQDFLDGKWRLSSDEMAACYDTDNKAGCTEHGDYWEAWSDTVRDMWFTNCNLAHNSCTNDLGNGTVLKFNDKNFDGTQ